MNFETIIDSYKEEIIKATQNLIKIKSVKGEPEPGMPCGRGPYEALKYVLNLSESMGFTISDIDGYVGYAEFGDGEETVGVLVHVDVVPEGDGWTLPPFSGELRDDKIYGRGSIDDKGPTIAVLFALKALKACGIKLGKKIRIVFGTDEESGFDGIHYYLSKEKPFDVGFTPDAQFPLISGEKGILLCKLSKEIKWNTDGDIHIISISGGIAPNMVPSFCKAVISIENGRSSILTDLIFEFKQRYGFDIEMEVKDDLIVLNSTGRTAHGSTPEEGLNAISIMMLFLGKLRFNDNDLFEVIKAYNEKIGMEYNGESMSCNCYDKMSGELTMNVGLIESKEDKLEIFIDIRYPISFTADEIIKALHNAFDGVGISMKQLFTEDPIYFSKDHYLLQKLIKAYQNTTKDQESKPLVIGGATYARTMKNVIAFGPVFPGEAELAHKSDEYITLESLFRMTNIYANALYELSKKEYILS